MSLTRKPEAPERIASKTYSSSSKVVSMTTLTSFRPASSVMRRVAARPSSRGMRMSIRTTSGRSSRTCAQRLLAVGGLSGHLDVRLRVEQCLEARPDQ